MLKTFNPIAMRGISRAGRQGGVILIITLIVLVAISLAAVSLIRSVDTANLVAGNLAFQQSATHSADAGIEAAVAWLQANPNVLAQSDTTNGYLATAVNQNPAANQTWDAFWTASLAGAQKVLNANSAGNQVSYVIHRQCAVALLPTQGGQCASSPVVASGGGNSEESGEPQLTATGSVYYRITVRVAGPRNTVSYVQAMVSL